MRFDKPKVYAAKHCDFDTRMSSRSGGVFSALSDVVLEQNGVVYGCILMKTFRLSMLVLQVRILVIR